VNSFGYFNHLLKFPFILFDTKNFFFLLVNVIFILEKECHLEKKKYFSSFPDNFLFLLNPFFPIGIQAEPFFPRALTLTESGKSCKTSQPTQAKI